MSRPRTPGQVLERAVEVHTARALDEALGGLLKKRLEGVDKRMFALMSQDAPLDPQTAVQAWYEKKAIRDLRLTLQRQLAGGAEVERHFSARDTLDGD